MASLQQRNGSWRVIFRYHGLQHFVTIGEVEETEAQGVKARYEYLLRLLKQRLLTMPSGMDIVTFLRLDGKPADATAESLAAEQTFDQLRDAYVKIISNRAVETKTLYTSRIHLAHIAKTLGERFPIASIGHADLQRHINRRSSLAAVVTIKKELDTLRSLWNWAKRTGHVQSDFPGSGLVYPKSQEKLPFMTWKEIERRIAAGGDPAELWECLYLRENEVEQFLDFVQKRKARSRGSRNAARGEVAMERIRQDMGKATPSRGRQEHPHRGAMAVRRSSPAGKTSQGHRADPGNSLLAAKAPGYVSPANVRYPRPGL